MSYARYSGLSGSSSSSGTVTSVALTVPAFLSVSGSPITTSGTLAVSLAVESANTIFAGPTTGSAVAPTFRAIVAADLPTGNLTDAGTDGIVITGGTGAVIGSGTSIAQHVADATHNGYLSSTDWNTFNGKQASGNYITALTGDITASGPGSAAATLATVNSNVGSFGTASASGTFTVNGKGLITAASSTSIQIAESQVTNLVSDLAGKQATGNYITALTGDATAAGPGSVALTLATVNGNVGSFGSSTAIPSFTVNAKGLITAASTNVVIAPAGTLTGTTLAANVVTSSLTTVGTIGTGVWQGTPVTVPFGGTGDASFTAYSVLCGGTTSTGALQNVSGVGTSGQVLTSNGAAALPTWQTAPGNGTFIGSAFIAAVAGSNITRSSATLGSFGTDADIPAPTIEFNPGPGTIDTGVSQVYAFTVNNLTAGYYRVSMDLNMSASSASSYAFLAINDGTNTSGRYSTFNASTVNPGAHVEGWFHYTTTGNITFELFGAASTGSITVQNDQTNQQVYFSITKF